MIRATTPADVEYIHERMKPLQRRSLLGTSYSLDCRDAIPRTGVTIERDGRPVAIAGAVITHPGVASTFFYSTDEMGRCIVEITRYFLDLFREMAAMGVHRVHALSLAEDYAGRKWKEQCLGAEVEAVLHKYGRNGEDYILHRLILEPPGDIL